MRFAEIMQAAPPTHHHSRLTSHLTMAASTHAVQPIIRGRLDGRLAKEYLNISAGTKPQWNT